MATSQSTLVSRILTQWSEAWCKRFHNASKSSWKYREHSRDFLSTMARLIHSPTSSPTQQRRLGNFQNAVSCSNTRYCRNLASPSLDFPPSDEDTSSGIDNTIRSLRLLSSLRPKFSKLLNVRRVPSAI